MISLHFISLLNNQLYTGAVGMGLSFCSMFMIYFMSGFINAYTTYGAQAYGRKDYYMMSIYHHRARVALIIVYIPLYAVTFFSKALMIYSGIEEQIAHHTSQFIRT